MVVLSSMPKKNIHIIGITGMPGSGKSVFSNFARELGYEVVVMGDVVREKVREEGMEPTPEVTRAIMLKLREKMGNTAVAQLTYMKIENLIKKGKNKIVIDGIRSQYEVEYFKEKLGNQFVIIAVHVDPSLRFKRLQARGRSDAPKTEEDFHKRDKVELKVGIGETIAYSNYILTNNGDLEEFRQNALSLLKAIEKGEMACL